MSTRTSVFVEVHDDDAPRVILLKGREAWAARELIIAGAAGCTPIDAPAPRWSSYVHKLRRRGIHIQSIPESHGGPFAGRHVRYVLCSVVLLVPTATANTNTANTNTEIGDASWPA